jgi:hypothetical protein
MFLSILPHLMYLFVKLLLHNSHLRAWNPYNIQILKDRLGVSHLGFGLMY